MSLINNETYQEETADEDVENIKKDKILNTLGPSAPLREAIQKNKKTIIPFRDYHNKIYFKTIEDVLQK